MLLFLAACGSSQPVPTETDPAHTGAGAAHYDRDRLLGVELTMDPADAEALAEETRWILELLQGQCLAAPFPSPYAWYEADVRLDGATVSRVGVRKKGLVGSQSSTKPGLKLDSDRFVDGQRFPDGTEHVTLNNSVADTSLVRQCLGYDLFEAAGIPSPRCNFAHVTGGDDDLGVYIHVEPYKRDFLERRFGTADGDLYEGALSDFHPDWIHSFDPKTDATDPSLGPLQAVADALEAPDETLLAELDAVIDLDAFNTYWAMEVLVGHTDGYAGNTNNFYVYRPDDRLVFLPWGIDMIFIDYRPFGGDDRQAVMANGRLARRLILHPEGRAAFEARLRELLDTVWDEDTLLASIDAMEALTAPVTRNRSGQASDLEQVREFVRGRRAVILDELDTIGLGWDADPRDPPCLDPVGTVDLVFQAQVGGQIPWVAGSSTLTLSLDDQPDDVLAGGAIVDPGEAILATGVAVDGGYLVVYADLEPADLEVGTHALDLRARSASLVLLDGEDLADQHIEAVLGDATLTVESANGQTISGRIVGDVLALPF
ncbi:MAG: CotH kinase family protein [Myxococcales bacterium]|nr:CotH kinase family protein [Myxococcales bacterium]